MNTLFVRSGPALLLIGGLIAALAGLVTIFMAPIGAVVGYATVRALRGYHEHGSDAPLWAGAAVLASAVMVVFGACTAGVGWVMLVVGWLASRERQSQMHRRWKLERDLRNTPTTPEQRGPTSQR